MTGVSHAQVMEWYGIATGALATLQPPPNFWLSHDDSVARAGFEGVGGPFEWRVGFAPSADPPGLRPCIEVTDRIAARRAMRWVGLPAAAVDLLSRDSLHEAGIGLNVLTLLGKPVRPTAAPEELKKLMHETLARAMKSFATRDAMLALGLRLRAAGLPFVEAVSTDLGWSLLRPSMLVSAGRFADAAATLERVELRSETLSWARESRLVKERLSAFLARRAWGGPRVPPASRRPAGERH
jgi:hypothetical protein